ncbi:hypothetical protein Lser_V15G01724 [Lactuca serriola]
MSEPPSHSEFRKVEASGEDDGQNRGGSGNTSNNRSFEDVAPRPESFIEDEDVQDPYVNPPSRSKVNPHAKTSGTEDLIVKDGTTTKPPPGLSDLIRRDDK